VASAYLNAWVAAFDLLVIGFAVMCAGMFGSYAAASQTALLLAVSIPVSTGRIAC
jgi:hypothetical protein